VRRSLQHLQTNKNPNTTAAIAPESYGSSAITITSKGRGRRRRERIGATPLRRPEQSPPSIEMAPQRRGGAASQIICRSHWVVARLPGSLNLPDYRSRDHARTNTRERTTDRADSRQQQFYRIQLDFAGPYEIYTGTVGHVAVFSFGVMDCAGSFVPRI
jgi:hypothetical protein